MAKPVIDHYARSMVWFVAAIIVAQQNPLGWADVIVAGALFLSAGVSFGLWLREGSE